MVVDSVKKISAPVRKGIEMVNTGYERELVGWVKAVRERASILVSVAFAHLAAVIGGQKRWNPR